jgi:SGNH domain (fused to AT3 domains)
VALLAVGVGTAAEATLPAGVARASDNPNELPEDPFGSAPTRPGSSPSSPGSSADSSAGPPSSSVPSSAVPSSPVPSSGAPTSRPATVSAPVPADLTPSLAEVRNDAPIIYDDGCHLDQPSTTPKDCVFGDAASSVSVALFGDSHAAQWFPALERLARVEHWRLLVYTKSACTPADVTVWNPTFDRAYTECDAWREAVFAQLGEAHPDLVVMAMSRTYTLVDGSGTATVAQGPELWDAGIAASLARLSSVADAVALIGDTPRSRSDPAACLSRNLPDSLACATKLGTALNPKRTAADAGLAAAAGVTFVDPSPWVCPSDPCPAVIGRYLVFRDSHHLTTAFATALSRRLLDALPRLPPR